MKHIFNAFYLSVFIYFLRKFCRKVIIPIDKPDWGKAPYRYIFTAPLAEFELLQGAANEYSRIIATADGNRYLLSHYRFDGFRYVDMDTGNPLRARVVSPSNTADSKTAAKNIGLTTRGELQELCNRINEIQGL